MASDIAQHETQIVSSGETLDFMGQKISDTERRAARPVGFFIHGFLRRMYNLIIYHLLFDVFRWIHFS